MNAPTNMSIAVVTNTSDTFQLGGSTPTFVISVPPTNGYIINLNGNSGLVTYVETNGNATVDSFIYCTSNSPTCMKCASVYVSISQQLACGDCFVVNPVLTSGCNFAGDVLLIGSNNLVVCVYYTNCDCVTLLTNCTITDNNGNAAFDFRMCNTSSNFCIASLASFSNLYFPTSITVSGAGCSFDCSLNSTYKVSSSTIFAGILNIAYTNVNASSQWYMFYSTELGGAGGSVPNSYCILTSQGLGTEQSALIDIPQRNGINIIWPGWVLNPEGTAPVGLVTVDITNIIQINPICQ